MMRIWGLDVLRCVGCKHYPLELYIIEEELQDIKDLQNIEKPYCKLYCGLLKEKISLQKEYPCEECLRRAIRVGVLYCPSCKRWYPIRDGIVYMMTDSMRKTEKDKEFLRQYREKIPEFILKEGRPFNLSE